MDDDALVVQVRREPGYAIVTVAGDVDIATAPQLRQSLAALAAGPPVIADLDQVSFIEAAGLGVLAAAARQAAAHGGSLHVACAQPRTRKLLRLTGLAGPLRLTRTVAEAIRALETARDTTASPHHRREET